MTAAERMEVLIEFLIENDAEITYFKNIEKLGYQTQYDIDTYVYGLCSHPSPNIIFEKAFSWTFSSQGYEYWNTLNKLFCEKYKIE